MGEDEFSRLDGLLCEENRRKLQRASVAIFGLGGVGAAAAEGIARSFVGNIHVFDADVVEKSNLNRQLCALNSTLSMKKTDVIELRIKDINLQSVVYKNSFFFDETTLKDVDFTRFDFIIDAIDSVDSKILLIETAEKFAVPIASSLGTANKVHPELLQVSDIYNTGICPLAKVIRRKMREKNLKTIPVVYSTEKPYRENAHRNFLPSAAFVPNAAGFILAGIAVNHLISR